LRTKQAAPIIHHLGDVAMRWIAGLLLVSAAALKAVELVVDPAIAMTSPLGRYFLPVAIGVEFAVGVLLLSGLYWRTLRPFSILLFTAFAAYSLYLALNGAASCGCFGPVHVNPWWTFGLDCAVVVGLLVSTVVDRRSNVTSHESGEAWIFKKIPSRHAVAVVMGIAVVVIALLFRYAGQQTALANGLITTGGNLVILEPEKWVGQKLPIAESVDVDLSTGEWIVLLHRHDCPVCQEQVPQYEQRASAGERVALIEVPPYEDFEPPGEAAKYGRLKEDHEWFVQTPVELRLQDGIITAVTTHEH